MILACDFIVLFGRIVVCLRLSYVQRLNLADLSALLYVQNVILSFIP